MSKIEIFQDIKKELLEAAEENLKIELDEVLKACVGIPDGQVPIDVTYEIEYKRKVYYYGTYADIAKESGYPCIFLNVAEHLRESFDFVLMQESTLAKESARLFQHIRVIFNECETLADLYAASPGILHKFYPANSLEKHTLTAEVLEKLESTKDFVRTFIKQRMLTNFITT